MSKQLQEFLRYYLPDADLQPLIGEFKIASVDQHTFLFTPGQKCDYLAFIESGCFRVYYYDKDGKVIVTWFSFTGMVVTDMLAFYNGQKCSFYVEALEKSIIYKIKRSQLEKVYAAAPEYREFGQRFAEEAITMLMQRTLSLHTMSPEARYEELLKQPEFLQKVPLKYLASYLGITDTSLSRLRRRLSRT